MKFDKSFQDLETIISSLNRTITSTEDKGNMYQIKTNCGAKVNLYKNGTLQFQGSPKIKQAIETDFANYNGESIRTFSVASPVSVSMQVDTTVTPRDNKQVFIVHGHDSQSREQLELILHKLGLDLGFAV